MEVVLLVEVPDNVEISNLAFPHARIVDLVKSMKRRDQFVRKEVYFGLNILLEGIAREIISEMIKTDKAYISKEDLDRAAKKFESADNILMEKRRIMEHLHALREDIDKLARDLERA